MIIQPLEVLRISTVVDVPAPAHPPRPLEVLRISTVVDTLKVIRMNNLWKY